MEIRKANKFDADYFISIVLKLQQAEHNEYVSNVNLNVDYLRNLFHEIIYGKGLAYIATDNGKTAGICVGLISPNIWDPSVQVMHQLIIYVEEEYRYTHAAHEFISIYTSEGEELIKEGRIFKYTFVVSEPMFNLKLERFGYELKEKTWIGGI